MADAPPEKESKSSKPDNRQSETMSSHSDFQPPSSQVPTSSQAKSVVRRTTMSANAQTQPHKEKDASTARRARDSIPARSNVSSAHRTKLPRKSPKVRQKITKTTFRWLDLYFPMAV